MEVEIIMRKLTRVKTDYTIFSDVLQHHYLKKLGAYNPLKCGDYDILGDKTPYGILRYMPIHTKIPTASSIYTKWNSVRRGYDILFLSR